MSGNKRKEAHSGWPLLSKDAQRFRSVTKRVLRAFGLSVEAFAEVMGFEPRTLYRYLSPKARLYDSQANAIREALLEVVNGDEARIRLFDELYRLQSPEMQNAWVTFYKWEERQRLKSPDEQKKERRQATRLVLARFIANRLIRDCRVSPRRKREFQEALYSIFEQAQLVLENLTIRQLMTIKNGPPVSDPDGFLFVE